MTPRDLHDPLRVEASTLAKLGVWFLGKGVLVWTPGKVGTLSVVNTLNSLGIRNVHVHSISSTKVGYYFISYPEGTRLDQSAPRTWGFSRRLKISLWRKFARKVTVIGGVRDPFSRCISAFCEQSYYLGINLDELSKKELLQKFELHHNLFAQLNFFQNEWSLMGVDPYSVPFYKFSKGESQKAKWFIFNIKYLDQLEQELAHFLGQPTFPIHSANVTSGSKPYLYLKSRVSWPEQTVKTVLDSRYCKHFFTQEELSDMKTRWACADF